jgi:hypothetical protein
VSRLAGISSTTPTLANRDGAATVPAGSLRLHDLLLSSTGLPFPSGHRDRRPWAKGGRFVGRRTSGNVSTGSATATQLDANTFFTRLECSGFPVNLKYRGAATSNVGNAFAEVSFWMDGAVVFSAHVDLRLNNGAFIIAAETEVPAVSGSHTFEVRFAHVNVAGTITVGASTSIPAVFIVEEVKSSVTNGAT